MRVSKKMLIVILSLPLALTLKANTGKNDGTIQGMVVDAVTKKPIPGVVVTMTGSKLNAEMEASTDASGAFKIGKFPPGADLTIYFEKKGYKVRRKEIINTKDGAVYKISLDMIPYKGETDTDDFSHPLLRMSGGMGM